METAGLMRVDREPCELLRAVVRRPADSADQSINLIAGSIHDWESVLKLAREHRVLPLLFLRLADMESSVSLAAQEHLRLVT